VAREVALPAGSVAVIREGERFGLVGGRNHRQVKNIASIPPFMRSAA
jgi:hypothetical protein